MLSQYSDKIILKETKWRLKRKQTHVNHLKGSLHAIFNGTQMTQIVQIFTV
jgi:hypothetical protein